MLIRIQNALNKIREIIEKMAPRQRYISIGFIIGFLTPIAAQIIRKQLIKLQKARKQTASTYVGIQLGGTNFNVAIGAPQFDRNGNLIGFSLKKQMDGRTSKTPQQTVKQINNFLAKNQPESIFGFDFVGIASFGPLCLDKSSKKYGNITSTPKVNWRNMQLLKTMKNCIRARDFVIQTDVNAAALAEFKLGHHKCKQSLVYVTVGTGVGVGVVTQGKTLHGLTHPQGGHIVVKKAQFEYEKFEGVCPYHKNCLQGMVCNGAIGQRLGISPTNLHEIEDESIVWKLIGFYLAQLSLNLTLTLSPQVIIIGGGIMNRKIIYKYTREYFREMLAQYVQHPLMRQDGICEYIKEPNLGSSVGVKGAMVLNFMKQ